MTGWLIPPDVWSNFKAMTAFVQAKLKGVPHRVNPSTRTLKIRKYTFEESRAFRETF